MHENVMTDIAACEIIDLRSIQGLIHRWSPIRRMLHAFPSVRLDAMHPR